MSEVNDNDNLILVSGEAATGKSACLRKIKNPEGVVYFNCEGKKLPFRAKFASGEDDKPGISISDPYDLFWMIDDCAENDEIHTIVIDTATRLMDLFNSLYIATAADGRAAWGKYSQYWKDLMSNHVAKCGKNVIILAHSSDTFDKEGVPTGHSVQVQGGINKIGIESYFTTVISAKKVTLKELKKYSNEMLTITPEEEMLGFKYILQTKLTKRTMNEKIRSGFEMWDEQETYIDNDITHVINRTHDYYAD